MADYRATPEQWEACAEWASYEGHPMACILELRARVERLELGAGIRDAVAEEVQRSFPIKPNRSLVERVRNAIASEYDPKDFCWDEARAAIREVMMWFDASCQHHAADELKHELKR